MWMSVEVTLQLWKWLFALTLGSGREKKIKSFEALQTQPSPLPSEKAASTRNASTTISNK